MGNTLSYFALSENTVSLQWSAWREGTDIGDLPLVSYVLYRKTAESDWIEAKRVNTTSIFTDVDGLDPDTDYSFSIAAVRDGPGGTGPRSDSINATTLCGSTSSCLNSFSNW